MTPLLCLVIAHPIRHNPKAWTHYGCKGTTIFADMQMFMRKRIFIPSVWVRYPFGVPILTVSLSCDYLPIILRLWYDTDSGVLWIPQ